MNPTAQRRWSNLVGASFAISVVATIVVACAYALEVDISAWWIAAPIAAHAVLVVLGVISLGVWTFGSTFFRRFTHNLSNQ